MSLLNVYAKAFYDFQEVKNGFKNRLRSAEEVEKAPEDKKDELARFEKDLQKAENSMLRVVESYLEVYPVYTEFLTKIRGCAVRMSACMVTSIGDIKRFATVSKLWAYAGLHVIDGRAARRTKGEKSNWNQFLKTKLHVLADCLIKQNFDPDTKRPLRYRKFYDDYKTRMENRASCHLTREEHSKKAVAPVQTNKPMQKHQVTWLANGCTKGHTHNMAMRYVQKMFLQDLFMKWYELSGLEPPTKPYAEAMLGRVHGEYPKEVAV